MRLKKAFIGRQQCQSIDHGSCRKKSISRILMGKINVSTHQCDDMRDCGLPKWDRIQQVLNPSGRIRIEFNTFLLRQQMHFPQCDGREPELVERVSQFFSHLSRKVIRFKHAPEKNVGIEQQLHARRVSHSSGPAAGLTISPRILPE